MKEGIRLRIPPEWLVFLVIVVDLIGFGIVIPILPFMSPALGGDEVDVALVISTFSLCAGLVGPFWGSLSDRIGRKPVLMICLFGGALSYVILGIADALWMLYFARAFGGLMSGSLPVASALMADLSAPERRAKAMGLVGTAFGLGLILGPLIGGLLAGEGNSFLLPGLFAAGMSFASVALAAVLLSNDRDKQGGAKKPASSQTPMLPFLRERRAMLLTAQYVLQTFGVSAAIYLSPLWLAAFLGWGPKEVGILFGLVGVAMIIIQGGLIDWLTRRFGLVTVLSAGSLVFAVSLLAAIWVEGEIPRAFVVFALFAGATCCLPVLNTIATSVVFPAERGRMMGLTALASSVGRVLGPLVTGAALALTGYGGGWFVIAVPVVALFVWSRTSAQRYASPEGLTPYCDGGVAPESAEASSNA